MRDRIKSLLKQAVGKEIDYAINNMVNNYFNHFINEYENGRLDDQIDSITKKVMENVSIPLVAKPFRGVIESNVNKSIRNIFKAITKEVRY